MEEVQARVSVTGRHYATLAPMNLRKLTIVVCGVPMGLWIVGEVAARSYLSSAMASGWPTPTGRLAAVADLFPPHPANATARKLEREAWPLGIDIYPRGPERPANLGTIGTRWKAVDEPLRAYVLTTVQQERAAPQAPPAPVAAFLTENESAIQALAQMLIASDPPSWRVRVADGLGAPFPNFLGHLHMVRLLAASSLHHASRNEQELAWSDLHAASRLPEDLFRRPEPVSQLMAVSETSVIVGAMRQLTGPPPPWALTWPREDLQRNLNRAWVVDAWNNFSPFDSPIATDLFAVFGGKENGPSFGGQMLSMVLSPYLRMSAADAAAAHRSLLRHNSEPPACDQAVKALPGDVIPDWNLFGRIALSPETVSSSFRRLRGLHAHTEGTRLLLHARLGKQQTGTWPAALPPIPSPCAQRMWSYAATPTGIQLHANVKIPPIQTRQALNLPPRFEE